MNDMRVTPLSDTTILCESKQQVFAGMDYGVWTDSGILTGNLHGIYLQKGSVLVTTHEKAVFNKLVREIENG